MKLTDRELDGFRGRYFVAIPSRFPVVFSNDLAVTYHCTEHKRLVSECYPCSLNEES